MKILFDKKEIGQLIAGKTLQFQIEGKSVTIFGSSFDVIVSDNKHTGALALRSENGDIKIVEEPEEVQHVKETQQVPEAGTNNGTATGGQPGENGNQPGGGSGEPVTPAPAPGAGSSEPNSVPATSATPASSANPTSEQGGSASSEHQGTEQNGGSATSNGQGQPNANDGSQPESRKFTV